MQIRQLFLYNKDGVIRQLHFNVGKLNIITGKSATGKSAIIDIVDYCLGRSSFMVPEGAIRDNVAWYGVIFTLDKADVIVAKPAPVEGAASQSQVYFARGGSLDVPSFDVLKPNSTDDAVRTALSTILGINPNKTMPETWSTRDSIEANIRHTVHYLFQPQSIVASQDVLFYRQIDQFMPQAIKDTLPYFLGAIREDRLQLLHDYRVARRQLKLLERDIEEADQIVTDSAARGIGLIGELKEVGLVPDDIQEVTAEDVAEILRTATEVPLEDSGVSTNDDLANAQEVLNTLRVELRDISERIAAARKYTNEARNYASAANQHVFRLKSLDLVPDAVGKADPRCPLCESPVHAQVPAMSLLRESLEAVAAGLDIVSREEPQLQEHLDNLLSQREGVRIRIDNQEAMIRGMLDERNASAKNTNLLTRRARVLGRVSLYLESFEQRQDRTVMDVRLGRAREEVSLLEGLLSAEESQDIEASILSRISLRMTEWAERLRLEHSGWPFRFDVSNLTVVADRPGRPIPMTRMGGGENWLGCHLICLLALHSHFVEDDRPVPRFLFLDQPTQVYFPSLAAYGRVEGSAEGMEEADADVEAVRRMFDFLYHVADNLDGRFQIIVLEHAFLPDARFQESLVEPPWTHGNALVPLEWVEA
jgi:hypothetical protein